MTMGSHRCGQRRSCVVLGSAAATPAAGCHAKSRPCHTSHVDLSGWGPIATVVAALVAITGVIISSVIQRRAGRETTAAAKRSADAAQLSAAASERSSKAAERAAEVNEKMAGAAEDVVRDVGQRALADALAKRYQEAATQLGQDKAAVRLAGVYAMARLADDWPDQRQTCIDVLCAYLRMPSHHETAQGAEGGEKQVRIAILRVIGDHLDAERSINWCDCDFDFSYAELSGISWSEPTFTKQPNFSNTHFTEFVAMNKPQFLNGVDFLFAKFGGLVQIQDAHIPNGDVLLYGAEMRTGVLTTSFLSEKSTINLSKAICHGEFGVVCSPASKEPQGRVAFSDMKVKPGATFYLDGVDIESAEAASLTCVTSLPGATVNVEPTGRVRLPPSFKEFSGKDIYSDVWKNPLP